MQKHSRSSRTVIPGGLRWAIFLSGAICLSGCATWNQRNGETIAEATSKQTSSVHAHRKSIVLVSEFTGIRPPSDPDIWSSLWQWVDETSIDSVVRRRWLDNGLRIGIVTNQERFRQKLTRMSPTSDAVDEFLDRANVSGTADALGKSIPMGLGKRYELMVSPPTHGTRIVLARMNGGTVAQELTDPLPLLAIISSPGSSVGQIKLTIRPEIQHGTSQKEIIESGSGSGFRAVWRRKSWSLADLEFDIELSEGDMLVITPTDPPIALGKTMLTTVSPDQQTEHTVVLLTLDHMPRPEDVL